MAEIIIHRGMNQIGGSITEIKSSTTRIFVDFGGELPGKETQSTDSQMIELMQNNPPDAVLFTHYHGDHVGLLAYIPNGVKIYIGEVARKVLLNIRETILHIGKMEQEERKRLQREYDILNSRQVETYNLKHKEMKIPNSDISFTPYLVDHSAYDSYMLRICCDGEMIVHMGDYRNHGRLGKQLLPMIKEEVASVPVDYLITEGTSIGNTHYSVLTEADMKKVAVSILMENKYAFLVCSSTNMDSLYTFYKAMIDVSKKDACQAKRAFYANNYVKKQLKLYTDTAGRYSHAYKFYRSYAIRQQLQFVLKTGETQEEYMRKHGFLMMVGTSDYYRELMDRFKDLNPLLIYSMWEGYITEGPAVDHKLKSLVEAFGKRCIHLHTSGHASPEVIAKVINVINPTKAIIPIHTEHAAGFMQLDISDDLKRKVLV